MEKEKTEKQESPGDTKAIEAYQTLIDFQKWTYDTYQRDASLFLTIEVVALGLVGSSLSGKNPDAWSGLIVVFIAASLGIFLTISWASRQRREFYMSKGRLERLKALESQLPLSFRYFTTTYQESRKHCEEVSRLPFIGERLNLLPHIYRKKAFLKSLALQQAFLALWVLIAILVIIKAYFLAQAE